MPPNSDKTFSDGVQRERPEADARVAAEAIAFSDAVQRIRDDRHRACIRWLVLGLARHV